MSLKVCSRKSAVNRNKDSVAGKEGGETALSRQPLPKIKKKRSRKLVRFFGQGLSGLAPAGQCGEFGKIPPDTGQNGLGNFVLMGSAS